MKTTYHDDHENITGFPELSSAPRGCSSWIIRRTIGDYVETNDRETALHAFRRGLYVRTAYDHLADSNPEP